MTKRLTISSLIFAMLLAFMPVGSFAAKNVQFAYPVEEPDLIYLPGEDRPIFAPRNVQFIMDVKWGQVEGPVEQSNQVLFDGSISSNIGSVSLMETMRFEQHDDFRDQITHKQNPVSWRSWIITHWDGVKVMVNAPRDAKITIDTYQGTVILKVSQLAWSDKPFKLKMPDGREIVISTQRVPQTHHYMKVYWGAVESGPSFSQINFDLQESQVEELEPINIEVDVEEPTGLYASLNFDGILGVSGATLQFMSSYLFEPEQGDQITYQDSSTVAWDSTIINHIDGVWLRTYFKNEQPRNERFGIALLGDANLIRFYNMKDLFANKRTVESINVYGMQYQLVIETFTIESSGLDLPLDHKPLPLPPMPREDVSHPDLFDLEPSADTENAQDENEQTSSEPEYISVSDPRRFCKVGTTIEPNTEIECEQDHPEIVNFTEPEYITVSDPRRFDGEKPDIYEPKIEETVIESEPQIEEEQASSDTGNESDVIFTHEETLPLYDPDTFSQPIILPLYKEKMIIDPDLTKIESLDI